MDVEGLNREKDFGIGPIHDDSFIGGKISFTPLNKLREMGGLVNREEMEKLLENTTGISTLVLKNF